MMVRSEDFGEDFAWGVSSAAFQTEGGWDEDGKVPSIWDVFTARKGKVKAGHDARVACDFYHRYPEDIALIQQMQIPHFRFSLSWSRILLDGKRNINQAGLDYYDRLIDTCLEQGITPWVTLYHWDLPQVLQEEGGWKNRDILGWFEDYVQLAVSRFGDRVRYWMVLNEPAVFTGAGYFFGVHAPGLRGLPNFLPAVHHATMAMGVGGRVIRTLCPKANVGTTFSCSSIHPLSQKRRHLNAAIRADALINRMFVEPVLGLGYPIDDLPVLRRIEKYILDGDQEKLAFSFDFIGIQNYTREVVKHSLLMPYIQARIVPASDRDVATTDMGWEVYPESLYEVIKKYSDYDNMPSVVITENGAAFSDTVLHGKVTDDRRVQYLQQALEQVLRAKQDGLNVHGYFVWTLLDNFEWAEGYYPRFGLVYVDFKTQQRIIKQSGEWYSSFIRRHF